FLIRLTPYFYLFPYTTLFRSRTDPRVLIIRLRHVPFVDATGLQTLEDVVDQLRSRNVAVIFTEANERVRGKMARMCLLKRVGEDNVVHSLGEAIARLYAGDACPSEPPPQPSR